MGCRHPLAGKNREFALVLSGFFLLGAFAFGYGVRACDYAVQQLKKGEL